MVIPALIEDIYVGKGGPCMSVGVATSNASSGSLHGEAFALSGNKVALVMKRGLFVCIQNNEVPG